MPKDPPSAHAEPVHIDVSILVDDAWSDCSGCDPRGYNWRAPGTYIIAAWSDNGRQLAEVKVEYVFDRDGEDVNKSLLNAICREMFKLYHPDGETTT